MRGIAPSCIYLALHPILVWHCIPFCYHCGMSKQIAVRLPDEIVEFVDGLVSEGTAGSRAAVVRQALERERREALAMRDAEILARAGADAEDSDMDSLVEHVRRLPLDLD